MIDQTNAVSHPWRRYLRFSVRGLIVLVLMIGLGLGWLVRSARIQREAVAAINRAGGSVHYRSDPNAGPSRNKLSGWKQRVGGYVGIDYIDRVDFVQLELHSNESGWQQAVDCLGDLDQVRRMSLMGPYVRDDVLAPLDGMHCLEELLLQHTNVSDAGLIHVRHLTNLRTLMVSGPDVGDEGLTHFRGLTSLKRLMLSGTRVTDAGLVHLNGLNGLSFLNLSRTQVTDGGVNELQRALPSLNISR
jgi:internalin A